MTETGHHKNRHRRAALAVLAVLGLVLAVFTASGRLFGESSRTYWRDMFKYDGLVEDAHGIQRQALIPLRSVWLLVDQESGNAEAMNKGNFMDCEVKSRERLVHSDDAEDATGYAISEMLLNCEDGARVFVVKGLAGTNY